MNTIAEIEGVLLPETVLIGDGRGDIQAAKETNCQFVGVLNEWNDMGRKLNNSHANVHENGGAYKEFNFPTITSFNQLRSLLIQ
jgi:phosphoglycolate phosphatase-like HAD superfamily hydrolase